MKAARHTKDYNSIPEKSYDDAIERLIDAVSKSNNDAIINELVRSIKSIAEKPIINNVDNSGIAKSLESITDGLMELSKMQAESGERFLQAIREIKPPNIHIPKEEKKDSYPQYKFEIKRNGANLMTEVVAIPVGVSNDHYN